MENLKTDHQYFCYMTTDHVCPDVIAKTTDTAQFSSKLYSSMQYDWLIMSCRCFVRVSRDCLHAKINWSDYNNIEFTK